MSDSAIVMLLFMAGTAILVAEIFLPSHGILSIAGLAFLGYGIYKAYNLSTNVGHVSVLGSVIVVPTLAVVAVKYFHRTPFGRRLAPDNPQPKSTEFAPQHEELKQYVGQKGRSVTSLRPVGICAFGGKRVDCVSETGMIDKDVEVQALGVRGHELVVRGQDS